MRKGKTNGMHLHTAAGRAGGERWEEAAQHVTALHTCMANKYAELTVSRFEHVIVSSSVARARADLARKRGMELMLGLSG